MGVKNIEDIKLTPAQESCVKFSDNKDLLIRGIAGSGKSLILIKKALKLAQKAKEENVNRKIAIFTFANTLVNYTQELMDVHPSLRNYITVATLDSELHKLYKNVFKDSRGKLEYNIVTEFLNEVVAKFKKKSNNRFLQKDKREFLADEIQWMKQRMIKESQEYLKCVRTGRGSVRPSNEERKLIYEIYKAYYSYLENEGHADVNVRYERLYDNRNKIDASYKYDYVLVDEAQDLSLNKLLLAKELAKVSITLAADFAQKIYRTGFTWKELGIDIRGNASKKLTGTHRNTYEILALAKSLMEHNETIKKEPDEYVEPEMPDYHGEKPSIFFANTKKQEEDLVLDIIDSIQNEYPDATIGVILRYNREIYQLNKRLSRSEIKTDLIVAKKDRDYRVMTPGVKLVTCHSSKGLEFNYVIIPYLDSDYFPKIDTNLDDDQISDVMDETRNILFVAMTRANYRLFIIACKGECEPSALISDLNPDLYETFD